MKTLKIEKQKLCVHITLNRPQVRNAFHPEMIQELTMAFRQVAKDPLVRVVLFSGAGQSFCAGADLDWMKSMARYTKKQNQKDAEKLFEMFQAIEKTPQVVLTKVQGHVMGGALGLLAVSDLVVAEQKTEFCFSEAKLGLSPAVISAFVKDKVSASQMSRWFLTADVFSAQQAKEMGLVHEICSVDTIESQTKSLCDTLLKNGPKALRATKKLIKQVHNETSPIKLKKATTQLIAQLRVSEEGQEGLQSFFEKRAPRWRLHE